MRRSGKAVANDEFIPNIRTIEREFARYLRKKYFVAKDIFGGEIFHESKTLGGTTLKAGRHSPTKSYVDPLAFGVDPLAFDDEGEIFDRSKTLGGTILKAGSHSPTKTFADPLASEDEDSVDYADFAGGKVKEKSLEEIMGAEESRCLAIVVQDQGQGQAQAQEDDDSSDSLQVITADEWYEIQSAKKRAESDPQPSKRRR